MNLSSEDQLRLNVLLANAIDAIRIDEQHMMLYALSGTEEARVKLNPNCRGDQYLKQVRELLSGQVLGSPGGYPVFLKRWTRMGQMRDNNLSELLKLGEPEAVAAVAGAPGLSDELARRTWWASPTSDTARCMLACEAVASGSMGKVLADHLVEHLPFESEPQIIIETVNLVLQPGLISDDVRRNLWAKGKTKRTYHIGFLVATPQSLPETQPARADFVDIENSLQPLLQQGNVYAELLVQTLNGAGQSFLTTAEQVLQKPYNQDDVAALLNAIKANFRNMKSKDKTEQDINRIIEDVDGRCSAGDDKVLAAVIAIAPGLLPEIKAAMILADCGEAVVTPIFTRTTAIGTLMRKKLEPVTTPLFEQIAILLGKVS